MRESDTIQVLGRGTDVQFTIDDSVPFEIAERSLREYLDICRGLYASGTVSVNVGRRILQPEQLAVIKQVLDEETGLTVTEYWCPKEILNRALACPEPNRALTAAPITEEAGPERYASSPEPQRSEDSALSDSPSISETAPVAGVLGGVSVVGDTASSESGQRVKSKPLPTEGDGNAQSAPEAQNGTAFDEHLPVNRIAPDNLRRQQGEAGEAELAAALDDEVEPPTGLTAKEGPATEGAETFSPAVSKSSPAHAEEAGSDPVQLSSPFLSPVSRGDHALIIRNTCRSGEVIRFSGDVVIYGDVNPGAEIVADGDIIVIGALRGMAHAGAGGNLKATIFALNLEAHRLQIGPHVGEAPRKNNHHKPGNRTTKPGIAYLRRRSIFVSPFTRRSDEYQGGILYEG